MPITFILFLQVLNTFLLISDSFSQSAQKIITYIYDASMRSRTNALFL